MLVLPMLLGLFWPRPGHCQSAVSAYANWDAFTSMSSIAAVCATSSGVWCATGGGVLRYDPHQHAYERLTRLDGLAGNRVLSVAAGRDGDVWFGTDGAGLSRYVASAGQFAPPVQAFVGHRVTAMAPYGEVLYTATESGVSVLVVDSGRVRETYRQFASFSRGTEVLAVIAHGDYLWCGTAEGAARARLAGANLQDPDAWEQAGSRQAVTAFVALDDELYCASDLGVYLWSEDGGRWGPAGLWGAVGALGVRGGGLAAVDVRGDLRWRDAAGTWQRASLPTTAQLLSLSAAGDSLWVGTSQGLAALGITPPPALEDPPDNHFYDLSMAADGGLWAASVPDDRTTTPHGLYHFDGSSWGAFGREAGLPTDFTVAVAVDGDGQVWAGTWGQGLTIRTPDGSWEGLNQVNSVLRGITSPRNPGFVVVGGLARDGQGNMWVSNVQAGLAVMDGFPVGRSYMHDLASLGLPPGTETGPVAVGDDGLKFIGTTERGLVVFDDGGTPFEAGGEWAMGVNTASEPRLSSDNVTALLANGGVLWIGTDNGLHRVPYEYSRAAGRLQVTGWREYRLEHGLPSTDVTSLARDHLGDVWVGTRGGLIQLHATGALVQAFAAGNSGLVDDRIESVLYDSERGYLWIGTFDGLSRLRLGGGVDGDRPRALVYPNPFVIGRSPALTFSGLPLGAALGIYAVDGSTVRVLSAAAGGGDLRWDGTNETGTRVASGVYYFVTVGLGPRLSGTFAVVVDE